MEMNNNNQGHNNNQERDENLYLSLLGAVENMLTNSSKIEDDAMRAMLLLDKLTVSLHIAIGFLNNVESKYSESLRNKAKKVASLVNQESIFLSRTLLNLRYSPDHSFGQQVMKSAQKSFEHSSNEHK